MADAPALRYAVLHHTGAPPDGGGHYDLLLEVQPGDDPDAPALWALATDEDRFPDHGARLRERPDHRRRYLWYEGPVSGGRGNVTRADTGRYGHLSQGCSCRVIELRGERLDGRFELRSIGSNPHDGWWTLKRLDEEDQG